MKNLHQFLTFPERRPLSLSAVPVRVPLVSATPWLTSRAVHLRAFTWEIKKTDLLQVHVVKQEDRQESLVVMKGAPERIIDRCSEVLLGNRVVPMTPELRAQIEAHQETLSRNGLRVLG